MAAMTYRRPGFEARHVRDLVFDKLPSLVRERLVVCLTADGAPAPLLVDASRRSPPSALRWRLVAAAAAVAEIVLWFKGFGDVDSPLVVQPLSFAAAHGLAIFALLFASIRAVRIARGQGGAPLPEGRYLFALDLLEVEGPRLRLTDLHTLRRVEARPGKRGASVALVFADGHEITFEAQPRAEALALSVWATVHAAAALILPDDHPRMERIDPFFELRVADDWASADVAAEARGSLILRAPLPRLAGALVVASALLGFGVHALRNRVSDDEMFAQAIKIAPATLDGDRWRVGRYTGTHNVDALDAVRLERAKGNEVALEEYLRHPGARQREAEAAIFELYKGNPRALAAEMRRGGERGARAEIALYEFQKGDLDELDDYVRRGGPRAAEADDQLFALAQKSGDPKSYRFYLKHGKRHADEVQSVLLPEAAYLDARKKDDVGLLGAFLREYPDSAHVEEIKAKSHALYADALRVYLEKKPSAAGQRFVTALLAELEARADPSVNVEIDLDDGTAIPTADVALGARYGADYLPAEKYFDGAALGSVLAQIRAEVFESLSSSFAHGTMRPTSPHFGNETGRPSINVACAPVVSDALVWERHQLKLANVRFSVELHAAVPARAQELSWRMTTPGLKSFGVTVKSAGDHAEQVDRVSLAEVGYDRMRTEAPAQIRERIELDF